MKPPEKKHNAGLRMLEVLKILLEKDVTRNELLEELKKRKATQDVYSPEVISKYFNTFQILGLKFKKDKHIYGLENALYRVDFTKKEKKIFNDLIDNVKKLNNKSEEETIYKIISKLNKYTTLDLIDMKDSAIMREKFLHNTNIKENIVTTLKNMIYEAQNINISYRKNDDEIETLTIELKEIIEQKGNIYILCYDPKLGRNIKICIDSITSIKQSPLKATGVSYLNSVVFQVYGRLASVYKLKQGEKVIDFSNNHITISNSGEDKDVLLHRLLKYGENCKILRPHSLQNEFLELTDEILKNLEAC